MSMRNAQVGSCVRYVMFIYIRVDTSYLVGHEIAWDLQGKVNQKKLIMLNGHNSLYKQYQHNEVTRV